MPFVSKAQQGWAHSHPEEFGKKNLAEFDAATKGMHNLPEHVKKMHEGGIVPEDGIYSLLKGEEVIAKDKEMDKHAGHGYKCTKIELHDDGSATITHEHEDGASHVTHAVADIDGVHDSMEQYLRPEQEESEEDN